MYSNNSGKKLSDMSDQSDQSDLSDKSYAAIPCSRARDEPQFSLYNAQDCVPFYSIRLRVTTA